MHHLLRSCWFISLLVLSIHCGQTPKPLATTDTIFHELDRANNGARSFPLRLSGPYRHTPIGHEAQIDFAAVSGLKKKLFQETSNLPTLVKQRAQAHFHILFGGEKGKRQALELLEILYVEYPNNPAVTSDLAVACFLVAEQGDGIYYWHALETLAKAKDRNSLDLIGEFNYALIVSRFTNRRAAQQSWTRYLQKTAPNKWAQEAKRHLYLAHQETSREHWWRYLPDLEQALLEPSTDFLLPTVLEFIGASQRLVERKLFPEWARAYQANRFEEAALALKKTEALVSLLEQVNGDCMYGDLLNSLLNAKHDPAKLYRLAKALVSLEEGQQLLYRGKMESSREPLSQAKRLLDELEHPYAIRALYLRGVSLELSKHLEKGIEIFSQVRDAAGPVYYRMLHGEAYWMLSLYYGRSGEFGDAFVTAQYCANQLAYFGGFGHTTGTVFNLANTIQKNQQKNLGNWSLLLKQADYYHRMVRGQRQGSVLTELTLLSKEGGFNHVIELLEEQRFELMSQKHDPYQQAQTLMDIIEALVKRGKFERASEKIQLAKSIIPLISDSHLHQILTHTLALVEAPLTKTPEETLEQLNDLLPFFEEPGSRPVRERIYLQKAALLERLGHLQEALSLLESRLWDFRSATAGATDETFQIALLESIDPVVEAVIDLRLKLDKPSPAYLVHEQFRALAMRAQLQLQRQTVEHQSDPWSSFEQRSLDDFQASLPNDLLIVQYIVNQQRLYAVLLSNSQFEWVPLGTNHAALVDAVQRYQLALNQRRATADLRRLSGVLHSMLIQPLHEFLEGKDRLLMIPDDVLHYLSFSGLWDPDQQLYLVETTQLATAPSAFMYRRCLERDRDLADEGLPKALIIGDPRFDRGKYPHLDRLPGAKLGAETIAHFYPNHTLLLGQEANRQRFLKEIGDYGVIHFGGHATIDQKQPMASALILAEDIGAARGGEVTAKDLRQLTLNQTRLTVLSGCSTGTGQVWEREGQNSLARPFLTSGVPGVLASSWDIDDEGTRELLTRFHRFLVAGSSATAALRAAQIELIRSQGPLASPAIWSAFQMHGVAFERSTGSH